MSKFVRFKICLQAFSSQSTQPRQRFLQKVDLLKQQRTVLFSTKHGPITRSYSSRIKWFWMPAGVGFALISFLQLRHILEREKRKHDRSHGKVPPDKAIRPWQVTLFKLVPTRVLSRYWGKINEVELPVFLRAPAIHLWTWAFECCLEEAEEGDVSKYPNLGAFFTRKLKPGTRAIDEESELVCPVDGRVLHFGRLVDGRLEQVKGIAYTLEAFIGPKSTFAYPNDLDEMSSKKQLLHCVLYLGPGDCHHFHSPTEWSVEARRHFPGELYSVSPWVLKGFKDVLSTNERVALFGHWKYGAFAMTAVGAYNVGSIVIQFEKELQTNNVRANKGSFNERAFVEKNVSLSRGEHVGWFCMGSAVVLVFEAPDDFQFCIQPGQKVMLGQPLGTVAKKSS